MVDAKAIQTESSSPRIATAPRAVHSPLVFPDMLSASDCNRLRVDATLAAGWGRGGMQTGPATARNCEMVTLESGHIDWLQNRFSDWIERANREYQFILTGVEWPVQVVRYQEGHYIRQHIDSAPDVTTRKLSFSVQLDEPASYEGGLLFFHGLPRQPAFMRRQGAVTVFPSYMLHEVTPVTRGVRHALVVWATGPHFR